MTPVAKVLTYDAVVLILAFVVVVFTDGVPQDIALVVGTTTLLKAPYDVWEARKDTALTDPRDSGAHEDRRNWDQSPGERRNDKQAN